MSAAEPLPDLDVQPSVDGQLGPLLAAITFDEEGRNCLRHALRQAAHTGQPAIALHVVHENEHSIGQYRRHDQGEPLRPNGDVARQMLADLCADVLARIPDGAGVRLRQVVVEGLPEGRIAEVAQLTGSKLIIVGGGTETPKKALDRWFGPQRGDAVRRRATCPVLIADADGNALGGPGLAAS